MSHQFGRRVSYPFYGVDGNFFKLGKKVYEAVEDEEDGLRSCLRELREVPPEEAKQKNLIFFKRAIDRVKVKEDSSISGSRLVSVKDDHEWLVYGTDEYDEYYPTFIFNYTPRSK